MFEEAFQPMFALLDAGIAGQRGDWAEVDRHLEPCVDRLGEKATDTIPIGSWSDGCWLMPTSSWGNGIWASASSTPSSWSVLSNLSTSSYTLHTLQAWPAPHRGRDTERAMEHYTAFLDAFIDPDPEYEWMVEEGRAELGRLEG